MSNNEYGVQLNGAPLASRRSSAKGDILGRRANLETRIHNEQMLEQIDTALQNADEYTRAFFILYYGLSLEHGRWSAKDIAAHYEITIQEVRDLISQAESFLPSPEHVGFARRYRIDYP